MEFKLFAKALFRIYWSYMSCAAFTGLALYIAAADRGNHAVIVGTSALGLFFFLLAAFRVWQAEYQSRTAIEKKMADEQPKLAISIPTQASGPEAWFQQRDGNGTMVSFMLQHIGGRVPTSIRVDQVQSLKGGYTMHFRDIPFVSAEKLAGQWMYFEVWAVGRTPEQDLEMFNKLGQGILLDTFVGDRPPGLLECLYPLTVRYSDLGAERSKQFEIKFNTKRYYFEVKEVA